MDETPGQRIERIAAAKGLPANKALAKRLGVSYEALRRWRTKAGPNRVVAERIAKVLGVPVEAFMFPPATASALGNPFAQEIAERLAVLYTRNPAVFRRAYMELSDKLSELEREAAAVVAPSAPAVPPTPEQSPSN